MVIPVVPASSLMSTNAKPREGSRDTGEGIIVSVEPDMCWTPMGGSMVAVPYRIWARQQDVAAMANTVRQTSMRTHVKDSLVLRSYGDEPGTGGGVISGTTGADCTPKTFSKTVFAEGRNVARHDDDWWMNHRNTFGRLYFTQDTGQYGEPSPGQVERMMGVGDDKAKIYQAQVIAPFLETPLVESPLTETPGIGRPFGAIPRAGPPRPAGPQLKPGPGTGPIDIAPGPAPDPSDVNRTSGRCQKLTICFTNGKGLNQFEYQDQLDMQQGVLNSQDPCLTAQRITDYQNPAKTGLLRDQGDAAATDFNNKNIGPKNPYPGGNAALHRLDMIAGGNPTDIARWGDGAINSSIGSSWRFRRNCLKNYAQNVCASEGKCQMAVTLTIGVCECKPTDINPAPEPAPYVLGPNEA